MQSTDTTNTQEKFNCTDLTKQSTSVHDVTSYAGLIIVLYNAVINLLIGT